MTLGLRRVSALVEAVAADPVREDFEGPREEDPLVAALLLVIAFSQMSTWAAIKFDTSTETDETFCEIWASQFDWRFRYPGLDGRFGPADDIDFERDPEFSRRWFLCGPNRRAIRLFFRKRVRDALRKAEGWRLAGGGPWLVAHRGRAVAPQRLASHLRDVLALFRRVNRATALA